MKLVYLIIGLLLASIASSIFAHQQNEAYTTMLFNARTGNLEVSHRFYLHDAEHALAKALQKKSDLVLDKDSMLEFAEYVRKSFEVKISDDKTLEFKAVGQEIDGKYFWVYQETAIDESLKSFSLNMTTLQEVWPKHINHINVEKSGVVRSVRLDKNSQWQKISIPKN